MTAGPLRLALRPDLGGAVAGLWLTDAHGEQAVLRSTEPDELASSRAAASYPLVPYSNRLGYRRFRWHGHEHTTAANFDELPHSVHGVGWQRPWQVAAASATEAELHYAHAPDAHWPFAFAARQRVELTDDALTLRLAITNTDAHAQPAGLGWHPYFAKRAGSHIRFAATGLWEMGEDKLPTLRRAAPGLDIDCKHLRIDNCFDGWDGLAYLNDDLLHTRIEANLQHLVVYTHADLD
ncbi:MAG: aldose 1-epimerase, partial [Betaproteobacteria bacterium]